MKKSIRTFLCCAMSLVSMFTFCVPTTSATSPPSETSSSKKVYSPEYPNAYVLIENERGRSSLVNENEGMYVNTVNATVFVENTYKMVNDEIVIADSRLLSEDEVNAIGIQNFDNIESQVAPRAATNQRGKLEISFTGYYDISGNSVTCDLIGNASWSGFDILYNAINNPALGTDFCGFAWSGGYGVSDSSASASLNIGISQDVYLADASPNSGVVWEFYEVMDAGDDEYYINNADFYAKVYKASMNGGGNTADAVMKYIHTYQQTTGGISISASSSGVSGGFSLSSTSKQWSIVCTLTGFPS